MKKTARPADTQNEALINAADKAIDNAITLLNNENTPFPAMYKQYKKLQSLWFRVVEDAADSNSKRLEEICIDLETTLADCSQWIKDNSPLNQEQQDSTEGKEEKE